jgi:hypothetical protein
MVNKKNEATREVRDTRKILVYVLGILALSVAANALITARTCTKHPSSNPELLLGLCTV